MPVDFRTVSITIPAGIGRRRIERVATFGSRVINAGVALNGFNLNFSGQDRQLNVVEADTDSPSFSGNTVTFAVECQYADDSANDDYQGYVTALVIAEVA